MAESAQISEWISALASASAEERVRGAAGIFAAGREPAAAAIVAWTGDEEAGPLFLRDERGSLKATVGVAVAPETFAKIHAASGAPRLAEVPPDQDAREFELHFPAGVALDILTTREPGGPGAIAKFLVKFGEGIQQVEFLVRDVDRATQALRKKFGVSPIYPATRAGADGTRVNFFLVAAAGGKKILVELVEAKASG